MSEILPRECTTWVESILVELWPKLNFLFVFNACCPTAGQKPPQIFPKDLEPHHLESSLPSTAWLDQLLCIGLALFIPSSTFLCQPNLSRIAYIEPDHTVCIQVVTPPQNSTNIGKRIIEELRIRAWYTRVPTGLCPWPHPVTALYSEFFD